MHSRINEVNPFSPDTLLFNNKIDISRCICVYTILMSKFLNSHDVLYILGRVIDKAIILSRLYIGELFLISMHVGLWSTNLSLHSATAQCVAVECITSKADLSPLTASYDINHGKLKTQSTVHVRS